MNREGAPGKSPEEMYIQQKVRVLLMLRKMGSNLTASEEEFLRTYAGVVSSQLSRLPQHSIDQGYLSDPWQVQAGAATRAECACCVEEHIGLPGYPTCCGLSPDTGSASLALVLDVAQSARQKSPGDLC
ncbi:hypothetical protein U0070_016039 [Myodes glareolus]|uniref:Beta-catenin-interacting protein 1 n=1 Tax=Myodes glareolus TaxID=447135 RepID=A0AAW0I9F2_MYOGA